MSVNKGHEGDEFKKLKKLGLNFKNSQDEYSNQPDSGGTIGGVRGIQEFGINIDVDTLGSGSENHIIQEYSHEGQFVEIIDSKTPEDLNIEAKSVDISDEQLKDLINSRVKAHPKLSNLEIEVNVNNHKVKTTGFVNSESEKLTLTELIEAMPAIEEIDNQVEVRIK